MPLKKDSYVFNQIVFGLLGLSRMFSQADMEKAFAEDSISSSKEILSKKINKSSKRIFDFIFEDLFSTEEDNDRIREVIKLIDDISVEEFIDCYRYREPDRHAVTSNGNIEALVAALFSQKNRKSLLDICSGQGVFLAEAIKQEISEEYCGIEINENLANVSKLKMMILGEDPEGIAIKSAFDFTFDNNSVRQYDAVFCHMPMSADLPKELIAKSKLLDAYSIERFSKRDSEWAFIKAMQRMTKPGGKSIALVRTGLLFTELGKQYRKEFVDQGIVESVILLPQNLLTNTGIQTALLILSENNKSVKMIDASAYYEKGRRINVITQTDMDMIIDLYESGGAGLCDGEEYYGAGNSPSEEYVEITKNEFEENDYTFEPTRYILKETISLKNECKLSDATTRIFRGVQIRADDLDTMTELYNYGPNCYLLNLSDISNGFIADELEEVNIEDTKKYKKYMLQQGDVVISARGTKINVVVADNVGERSIIVTGNLVVIRCNDSLDPFYLKAFLDSNDGKAMLKSIQTGSNLFAINPRQLQNMSFEMADSYSQEELGDKVKWMVSELRKNYRHISNLRQQLSRVYDDSKEV